jgi:biofilm PGA synthesis N-glycosyltransferase PgaC
MIYLALLFLFFVFYTIIGYPALNWAFAKVQPSNIDKKTLCEAISIIVCVRNEASLISKRIENILAMDYPPDLLEVIIVSDGSDDGTNEAVLAFKDERIKFIPLALPSGKAVALNAGIKAASHEYLLFADARQTFYPDVAQRLIDHFHDPQIGAASGRLIIQPEQEQADGAASGIGTSYWNYEVWLRKNEAANDSVIGVTGAIYALRKKCFTPLPAGTILDDLLIPLRVANQGFRIAYDADAIAVDSKPVHNTGELARKVRTLYGNLQLIRIAPDLFLPWKNRLWLRFISHKVLRLFLPAMLAGCLFSSLFAGGVMTVFGFVQLACWGSAWVALTTGNNSMPGKALSAFLLLNVAVLLAWKCFFTGNENVWGATSSNFVSPPKK